MQTIEHWNIYPGQIKNETRKPPSGDGARNEAGAAGSSDRGTVGGGPLSHVVNASGPGTRGATSGFVGPFRDLWCQAGSAALAGVTYRPAADPCTRPVGRLPGHSVDIF